MSKHYETTRLHIAPHLAAIMGLLLGLLALSTGTSTVTSAASPQHTVWAWDRNGSGQLGDGTNIDLNAFAIAPEQVNGLADVTAVAAGSSHSLTLTGDGTVWA